MISVPAAVAGVGPCIADWNETHIHNPDWPPHAKFHNAQTMSLGVGLAGAALLQLWRPADSRAGARSALDGGAVSAALYWVTQISALAYPGSRAVDPPGKQLFPQAVVALPSLALVGLGYALERRRLRGQG
ncbi:acetyltransferase [Streptomyces sp. SID4937]|nr:acetyltransferase [Streptomyces sp. SID4937]